MPVSGTRKNRLATLLKEFRPGALIDLGVRDGWSSRLAADSGWSVTAVDARPDLWQSDLRITWIQQDVRDTNLDDYDLVLCLGIFYHLTLGDQVELLTKAAGTPIIMDTHLAVDRDLIEVDGFSGWVYHEPDTLESSWGNESSFWPTLESFTRMAQDAGYVVDAMEPWTTFDRTFFLLDGR